MADREILLRTVFMQDRYQDYQDTKALVEENESKPLMVAGRVYEALAFSPEIVPFTNAQYRFLHAYRLGVPIEEAALKSNLSTDQVERFLAKPKTIAWLQDRAMKDHIKMEWSEPGKWYSEMNRLYEADDVPKHKIDILKEFGDRVCPKASRNAESSGTTRIEITIDPGALEKSKARRQSIEAEIVKSNEDPH